MMKILWATSRAIHKHRCECMGYLFDNQGFLIVTALKVVTETGVELNFCSGKME